MNTNYQKLGASASKTGLHKALEAAGSPDSASHFAQLCPDLAGDPEYHSFLHCDGAGTKSIVAYLAAQVTGENNWYAGLAQDALVMNLDDVFCLGRPEGLILANIINRNARVVSDQAIAAIIASYLNLQKHLSPYGINFELAGGETADCGDVTRTIAVDAVLAGRIAKRNLLSTDNIVPGQVIVGLSSSGQASWENLPNSGIGSNGLTLARHCLLKNSYLENYPEISDPGLGQDIAYCGKFDLLDRPESLGMSIAEALLSPTRTFSPLLLNIFEKKFDSISACIHISGGALSKVIRFGKGNIYIKDSLFEPPPLFKLIQKSADIAWREMYQVFNMGQRMEIYCSRAAAEEIIEISTSMNVPAQIIGRVEKNPDSSTTNKVCLETPNGSFSYEL